MMRRKLKSYFLLAVCMLMLVAQVFPHHHHSDIFCLSADIVSHGITETCSGNMHHSDDADRHSCSSICVTNFQFSTPDHHLSDITPDYSFYSILYSLASECYGLVLSVNGFDTDWAQYVESLHVHYFVQVAGFRAPPTCVILV